MDSMFWCTALTAFQVTQSVSEREDEKKREEKRKREREREREMKIAEMKVLPTSSREIDTSVNDTGKCSLGQCFRLLLVHSTHESSFAGVANVKYERFAFNEVLLLPDQCCEIEHRV